MWIPQVWIPQGPDVNRHLWPDASALLGTNSRHWASTPSSRAVLLGAWILPSFPHSVFSPLWAPAFLISNREIPGSFRYLPADRKGQRLGNRRGRNNPQCAPQWNCFLRNYIKSLIMLRWAEKRLGDCSAWFREKGPWWTFPLSFVP